VIDRRDRHQLHLETLSPSVSNTEALTGELVDALESYEVHVMAIRAVDLNILSRSHLR
jgi:hypothetical protein